MCGFTGGKAFGYMADLTGNTIGSAAVSWDPDNSNTQWSKVGSGAEAALYNAAMAAGNGKVFVLGGVSTLPDVDSDLGAAVTPSLNIFKADDGSKTTVDLTGLDTNALNGHNRGAVMAYDTDKDQLYFIGGFKPTWDGSSDNTWAAGDKMYRYDEINNALVTTGFEDVPEGCTLTTSSTYEQVFFHRQLTYVSAIRSLVLTQTCNGATTDVYVYDVDIPAHYRSWRKADLTAGGPKLLPRSSVFSTGKVLMISNYEGKKTDMAPVTFANTLDDFCKTTDVEGQAEAIRTAVDENAASILPADKIAACALKKIVPAEITIDANSKMHIKFKLPQAMRAADKFDYDMDILDSGLSSDDATNNRVKDTTCLNHFVKSKQPLTTDGGYHDGDFLEFTVNDPKLMMTECLSGDVFEALATTNTEHILMTVNGKFRLRVYVLGDFSPYIKDADIAKLNLNAFMTKPFQATMVYNRETQAMTNAQLYSTDMGDLSLENEAKWSATAKVMNSACDKTKAFVTNAADICVDVNSAHPFSKMNLFKLQATRIRIIKGSDINAANAVKFDTESSDATKKLYQHDGTTPWAAQTGSNACSNTLPSNCNVQPKFEMPSTSNWATAGLAATCTDCHIVLDLKVTNARRLSEDGARRLEADETHTVVTRLAVVPNSQGSNVKASSAVRPAGAAAAVATAAAAGAALLA